MKKIILLVLVCCLSICGCAGNQGFIKTPDGHIKIPDQKFSFMEPPSNWKKLFSRTATTSPTGENIPGGVFMATWGKSDGTSISIVAFKQTADSRKTNIYESAKYGLLKWEISLAEKQYDRVSSEIDDKRYGSKRYGSFREKFRYFKLGATLHCRKKYDFSDLKSLQHRIDTKTHMYAFHLIAEKKNFTPNLDVFNQLIDSIQITGTDGT